jgi:perosamine synthetase
MIPIAKPMIGKEEIEAVNRILESGMLTQGKEVEAFEKEFATYIGVKNAVAVANGTAALDLALKALGIKEGDEVITTPFTFIATANAILYQRARPVFADIDPSTYNLDPNAVLESITPKTKAIIVVHLYGQPCDMDAFLQIAEDHRLLLIEDCAQAHGAEFRGEKVGKFGDASVFSFYPTKNMTTGEGGMVVTDRDEVAEKVRMLRDHGQSSKYVHEELGYNLRMTNIAAAIGRVQLRKLDLFNEKRTRNARKMIEGLKNLKSIVLPFVDSRVKHVFNQFVVRVEERDYVAKRLSEMGIATAVHYPKPVHHQPLYRKLGYPEEICPNAIEASKKVLSLPVHPALSDADVERIIRALRETI